MAKFIYKMQSVLDIKIKLEDQERLAYGQAQMRLNEEQEKLKEIMNRRADYENQLREKLQGSIKINEINICKRAIDAMKSAIRDQMMAVSRAQRQMDACRKRLNTAIQERKMHELLKEKAFQEFLKELAADESKQIDQLVSFTYGNKVEEE